MIQLTFQPAFDPFHAIFRLLRLRDVVTQHGPLPRDHVRILDFYLLFPFRIEGIRLKPQDRGFRKIAAGFSWKKSYGDQPEDIVLFGRMEPMQIAAMETLASRGLLDPDQLAIGGVEARSAPLPAKLAARVTKANAAESELMVILTALATGYELLGPNGLKSRTNLLEYRYDAV